MPIIELDNIAFRNMAIFAHLATNCCINVRLPNNFKHRAKNLHSPNGISVVLKLGGFQFS
jgi:hypothetical protein